MYAAGVALTLAAAPISSVAHDAPDPMHRASFDVAREREVANDWVRALVGVSDEDTDPAALAERVNRTMAWGLELARGKSGIQVESGGYQTHPVHQDGRLRRWRASQELVLEGADPDAVAALVGELQSRLQLRSLTFTVSPERRRRVEEDLLVEALQAFQARAQLVTATLGAARYEVVRVDVETGGPPPRPVRMPRARVEATAVPPPAVEAGTTRIEVRARGTIEVQ